MRRFLYCSSIVILAIANFGLAEIRVDVSAPSPQADFAAAEIRAAVQMRGTKFNIPLDARTLSYTDVCDAAPLWTNRVGHVDWKRNYLHVLEDIRIAGGDPEAIGLPVSVGAESETVPRPTSK